MMSDAKMALITSLFARILKNINILLENMFDVCDNIIYIYTSKLKAPRLTFRSTITVEESYDKVSNLYYSITITINLPFDI